MDIYIYINVNLYILTDMVVSIILYLTFKVILRKFMPPFIRRKQPPEVGPNLDRTGFQKWGKNTCYNVFIPKKII